MTQRINITKEIFVPAEILFEVWSHADHLSHWYCPVGEIHTAATDAQSNCEPGGHLSLGWRDEQGTQHAETGVYQTVEPATLLVYTLQRTDGSERSGETRVTVRFEDLGGSSRIHLTHDGFDDQSLHDEFAERWPRLLEGLIAYLSAI